MALVQTDIKKLIAYSSVSHLGFVVLACFMNDVESLTGAILQMVNHGLSTGMLFLMIGIMYERRHTRELADYGGLAGVVPVYSVFFIIAVLTRVIFHRGTIFLVVRIILLFLNILYKLLCVGMAIL